MNIRKLLAVVLALSLISLVGCSNSGTPPQAVKPEEAKNLSLKVGLMPAVDSAPMFIAEKKGYFKELGLDVELIVFNNGQDRQSALQTNSIDGAMTDLIAVAANVNGGFDIKVTTTTSGMFPVLVKAGYEEKKDIKVAMMEVSVTNFLIDEWLGDKYNIEKVFINEIPARLEMIKSGKALAEKSEAVELFHRAYDKAVEDINKDENKAREILIEKLNLKPEIKESIALPQFSKASLPDAAYLEKVITWVENVLKKDMQVKPEDLVVREFVKQ